jgi:predicted aminopeptidase
LRILPWLSCLALAGCRTVEFYQQAAGGQWEIMRKARPNAEVLAAPETSPALRQKLASVERIRRFACDHLSLPGNDSYGTYADLGRPYVTWVLYAAPEFSLKPKTWWYPTLGRLDYRGFFREADARELAATLREDGHDVVVGGVDAYSTLGWFHDPVLNCFVDYPEIALAELLFHELTHRRLFRAGDTDFNESLATAYAEEGVKRWLRHENRPADLSNYEAMLVRRNDFYREIDRTRAALDKLYQSGLSAEAMRPRKAKLMRDLQSRFRELRRRWGGRGLESWLDGELGNAHLVSVITYQEHTPVFHKLYRDCGGDPDEFFKRAARMKLPEER